MPSNSSGHIKVRRGPLVLSSLELHALLATVALQPNAYGSSVADFISNVADYEPIRASVYVALAGLARKGFVAGKDGKSRPVQGGRGIRFWRITPKGNAALAGSLSAVRKLSSAANLQSLLQ
jgi:DNA-binding PadR family transcriptional regulator